MRLIVRSRIHTCYLHRFSSFAIIGTVSEPPLGSRAFSTLSRTRERVGVRVCYGLHSAQCGSLTLALSQREREMIIPQKVARSCIRKQRQQRGRSRPGTVAPAFPPLCR